MIDTSTIYEGRVLRIGVHTVCRRRDINPDMFATHAGCTHDELIAAMIGNMPKAFYDHCWNVIRALYNGDGNVPERPKETHGIPS